MRLRASYFRPWIRDSNDVPRHGVFTTAIFSETVPGTDRALVSRISKADSIALIRKDLTANRLRR